MIKNNTPKSQKDIRRPNSLILRNWRKEHPNAFRDGSIYSHYSHKNK